MRVGVLGLTGMGRSDQRRGAIWAAGWGIDGPDPRERLQRRVAAGGGAKRRRSAGERRRKGLTVLGCTVGCGSSTKTSSTRLRTQPEHPVAASTTRSGARRTAAVAALRRRRADGVEHEHPNQRHRRAPYTAAVPLSSSKRPDGGETAASGRKPSDGAVELGLWAASAQGC
jgi:hypothetical protein